MSDPIHPKLAESGWAGVERVRERIEDLRWEIDDGTDEELRAAQPDPSAIHAVFKSFADDGEGDWERFLDGARRDAAERAAAIEAAEKLVPASEGAWARGLGSMNEGAGLVEIERLLAAEAAHEGAFAAEKPVRAPERPTSKAIHVVFEAFVARGDLDWEGFLDVARRDAEARGDALALATAEAAKDLAGDGPRAAVVARALGSMDVDAGAAEIEELIEAASRVAERLAFLAEDHAIGEAERVAEALNEDPGPARSRGMGL